MCRGYRDVGHELADHAPSLFDELEVTAPAVPEVYPPGLYDGRPPAAPAEAGGTSRAAASAITKPAGVLRAKVLEVIEERELGLTDEEGQTITGMGANTWRPRRRELVLLGRVRDSGARRPTASGRLAVVWVVVPA